MDQKMDTDGGGNVAHCEGRTCVWIHTKNKKSRWVTIDDSVVGASQRTQHNQCSSKQIVTDVSNVTEEPATGELPIWKA